MSGRMSSRLLPILGLLIILAVSETHCRSAARLALRSNDADNVEKRSNEEEKNKLILEYQAKLEELANKLVSNDTGEIDVAIMTSILEVFLQYFELVEGDPETVAIVQYLVEMSKGDRFWETYENANKALEKQYGMSNDDEDDSDDDDDSDESAAGDDQADADDDQVDDNEEEDDNISSEEDNFDYDRILAKNQTVALRKNSSRRALHTLLVPLGFKK